MSSPFLQVNSAEWIASNSLAFAIFDRFPVSPGHTLVVTRRLVATWFDASADEQTALMDLVNVVKSTLDRSLNPQPDGYNVGFNCGDAAGQTVAHVHVHVIPRYRGDMRDPRGGVRHVIPAKGNYLRESPQVTNVAEPILSTGYPDSPLWDHLSWRIAGARFVDLLASFVQLSGLDVIEESLFEAIRNQARIRILVSDYLYISDPRALRRLLGWCDLTREDSATGSLTVRLVEISKIPSAPESFHPKAWRIADDQNGFVAVGSSNLSRPALQTGIEWNLLSTRSSAPETHFQVAAGFESLWQIAAPLTPEVVETYAQAAAQYRQTHFEPEVQDERGPPLVPRPWQTAALAELQKLRAAGYSRALVAVATGMGKTWLAAFDASQVGKNLGRRPRVLVIAHRTHILAQAESALSRVLDGLFGAGLTAWYLAQRSELNGDLVIASVQKLCRSEGLERLGQEHFDYVIIDEVHHAHAPSYRRVLSRIRGDFVLGLTATPERADGVDVASIFDDNLAYHASIGDGIADESLVPFQYIGIKDTVDFRQVPWRNGRFDPDELEARVLRSERMDRLWLALQAHPARRRLVFCCSRRHAVFTRDWLKARGVRAAAVFSGTGGDNYSESLQQLRAGALEAMCVVDMFNEGLDIPAVDGVVMLRPTESKVIVLQQLGRGLRAAEGKSRLVVIDFVGNHRMFAQRLIHLLSLRGFPANWQTLRDWLQGGAPELPGGCLLDVELAAKDMLKQFLPQGRSAGLEGYRALRDELGRRPTPMEVFRRGYLPRTIAVEQGHWFAFAAHEGDLSDSERSVVDQFPDWLRMLETTSLTKSYKMVVLRVLLDEGALFRGMDVSRLCQACRRYLQNHEVLRRDLEGDHHAVDHTHADPTEWANWWIRWPISRWLDQQAGQRWFSREEDLFRLSIDCPDQWKPSLEAMTEEIVDWRLAAYSQSRRLDPVAGGDLVFEGKVSHAQGRPILFLPDRIQQPGRPLGVTDVELPDGSIWRFKFVKVACNVASLKGETTNQLAQLLRDWFGPNAGLPGTNFTVRFESRNGIWHATPSQVHDDASSRPALTKPLATIRLLPQVKRSAQYSTHVPVYDISASAGTWGPEGSPAAIGWVAVAAQRLSPGMYVAQVIGGSMEPKIPAGSWCLFRPCPAGSREGRLLLVQLTTRLEAEGGGRYTVKRYHSTKTETADGWQHETIELQPLNREYASIPLSANDAQDLRVVGEFVAVIERPTPPNERRQ